MTKMLNGNMPSCVCRLRPVVDSIHIAALSHSLSEMIDLIELNLTQARKHLVALCR